MTVPARYAVTMVKKKPRESGAGTGMWVMGEDFPSRCTRLGTHKQKFTSQTTVGHREMLSTLFPQRRFTTFCGQNSDPVFLGAAHAGNYLVDFGRVRFLRRTPGPPPFSSMNSTPAASNARRIARSLAAVIEVSRSASSALRIVRKLTADWRERSSAVHLRSARAALI
jgi:hypothetical protein